MEDCLFCRIIAGEIPSAKVYEDETVCAIRDVDPKAPVHYLVLSKAHIESAAEIGPENVLIVARIFEVIAQIAAREGFSQGFRVVTNIGEQGGQSVPHLHFHVLAGRDMGWPPG